MQVAAGRAPFPMLPSDVSLSTPQQALIVAVGKDASVVFTFSSQPEGNRRLGDFLRRNLATAEWTEFRAAVAFVKRSGMQHVKTALSRFSKRGTVRIAVGVDLKGTSIEGLTDLLKAVGKKGEVWVFHNENWSTFHPKIYIFANKNEAEVYVGSGNLTEGGLFTNYEAGLQAKLDLTVKTQREAYEDVLASLTGWSSGGKGTSQRLKKHFFARLIALGYVVPERETVLKEDEVASKTNALPRVKHVKLFASVGVQRAPKTKNKNAGRGAKRGTVALRRGLIGFVMTLQRTDVGKGQVKAGTSRRSPEIFIPLVARNAAPSFWGYPSRFRPDPIKKGKMDRKGVRMRVGLEVIRANMMTWPDRHDFRIRNERLRSAGKVGDVLRLERAAAGSNFDYYAEVISPDTSQYDRFAALCTEKVRNSKKYFGYY